MTPLRFPTFSTGISRRLVITWQHKYQVHPTDSMNICHLITISVLSSLIQSRQMISNVRFCLFLKTNLMVSTLVRFVFYPVLSIFYLVLSQTYLICLCWRVSFHPNWKRQKLSLSIKAMMRQNQVIIDQYHYSHWKNYPLFLTSFFCVLMVFMWFLEIILCWKKCFFFQIGFCGNSMFGITIFQRWKKTLTSTWRRMENTISNHGFLGIQ